MGGQSARHRLHISQPNDWADRVFRLGDVAGNSNRKIEVYAYHLK